MAAVKAAEPPSERVGQMRSPVAAMDGAWEPEPAITDCQRADRDSKTMHFGFEYADAPPATDHTRVRAHKGQVPKVPVSRFTIKMVPACR